MPLSPAHICTRSFRPALLGAVLGALLVVMSACAGPGGTVVQQVGGGHGNAEPGADVGTATDHALPVRILDLPFTNSTGATVHLRDFTGKILAISDVMTLCQETCPLDTATFVQTTRDEDAAGHRDGEVFVSITVDPARDTTAQLAAYRQLFTKPPLNWLTLTGPASSVDALWSFLGVWRHKVPDPATAPAHNWRTGKALTYDIEHSDEVFFLDRRGHERFVLEGPPYAPRSSIPATLYGFMDAQGHQNVTSPPSTAWTETQARQVLTWLRG